MNETELQDLQQRYGSYCTAIVSRILPDPRDQEECLNDIWLRVWNALKQCRPIYLKGWLGTIARNCAISRRKQAAVPCLPLEDGAAELSQLLDHSPAEHLEGQALGQCISDFLHTQPEQVRIVFVRRYWYGDSVEQAAHHMGWTVGKTKTTLFRTRNKLKEYLSKEGYL